MDPSAPPEPLIRAATELRDALTEIAARFGKPTVRRDGAVPCEPDQPDGTTDGLMCWEYILRVPASPGAVETMNAEVLPLLADQGWQVTDRSSEPEVAYQFHRDGANLGVHISRKETGNVVLGGASACVPTRADPAAS